MCMQEFRHASPNGRFIILVPTVALLDQWYVSLVEDLRIPRNAISCFSGQDKTDSPNIVNLIVLNTGRELAANIVDDYDTFLIVDECHRCGSPMNAKALRGEHSAVLGLSATPRREYDEGFDTYIVPALGPIIYEYGYADAYKDGVIVPFHLKNVRVNLTQIEQSEYDRLTNQAARHLQKLGQDNMSERLKRILQRRASVSSSAIMRVPVAAKLAGMHRGQRTIIFHERLDKANMLATILANSHHSVTIYHTGINPVVRRDNLLLYRQGAFDILVTCKALDEGMNVPETTIAIIVSSTASLRQRIQRLGRVLRPASGKNEATIYTIYATDQEERRLDKEAKSLSGIASVQWLRGQR